MKKLIVLILVLACVLSLGACKKDNTPSNSDTKKPTQSKSVTEFLEETPNTPIKIMVADTTVHTGDEFIVTISIENEDWSWNSFEFGVNYDPALMTVQSVAPTEFTSDMLDISDVNSATGTAKVAYAVAMDKTGGGDIVTLKCKALAEGVCELTLTDAFMYRMVTVAATNEQRTDSIKLDVGTGKVTILK